MRERRLRAASSTGWRCSSTARMESGAQRSGCAVTARPFSLTGNALTERRSGTEGGAKRLALFHRPRRPRRRPSRGHGFIAATTETLSVGRCGCAARCAGRAAKRSEFCIMTELEIDQALARLEKLAIDASGWSSLYRDPVSRELWEVSYPHSERHGGGPRSLDPISRDEAWSRYPSAEISS